MSKKLTVVQRTTESLRPILDGQKQIVDLVDVPRDENGEVIPPIKYVEPGRPQMQNPVTILNVPRNAKNGWIHQPPIEPPKMETFSEYVFLCGNINGSFDVLDVDLFKPRVEFQNKNGGKISLGDDYFEDNDGYYFKNGERDYRRFTNFTLGIISRVHLVNRHGDEKILMRISLWKTGEKIGELSLEIEEYKALDRQVDKKHPQCHVLVDKIPNAKERFKHVLSLLLEKECFPEENMFDFWGWGKPDADGSRQFYHGGRSDCSSSKCLANPIDATERIIALEKAWKIFEVGPREVIYPLFIYGAAAYLDAIFTDSGHPLAHCMMAIAPSGSLKTHLFKTIYAPFVPEQERLFTVRSTAASMNILHEKTFDDMLVIDDFNAEGSHKEKMLKMANLQALIRIYSDKTPRAKCGENGDIKQYDVRGGCGFSGEESMSGELLSSTLRYIKVVFAEKLNGEKLRIFQDDHAIMLTFFSEFIRHAEKNYIKICEQFRLNFELARSRYSDIKALRLRDSLVHMTFTSAVVADFMVENDGLSAKESMAWLAEFENVLHEIISSQEQNSTPLEPKLQYIEAIWDLVGTGKVQIALSIEAYCRNIANYIGYVDGDLYMLKKTDIYKAVCDHFSLRRGYFPTSEEEISKVLKNAGITHCDAGGCLKKSSSKIPGRPRMLALKISVCKKILKIEDGENV